MFSRLLVFVFCAFSGLAFADGVVSASTFDVTKYMGKWYEIASIPQFFTRSCVCTTATYALREDATVSVLNFCRAGSPSGFPLSINGSARVPNSDKPAELKVKFFVPVEADYWVLSVADDYSHALVGNPSKKSLWVLSRTPVLAQESYNNLMDVALKQGFDVTQLVQTQQEGCFVE